MIYTKKLFAFGALTAITLCTALAPPASSAAWCNGYTHLILIDGNNDVYAYFSFRNDWVKICNISSNWGNISPALCNNWQAMLLTSVATQRPVTVNYSDVADNSGCSTVPTYTGAPKPWYIMLRKDQPQ
jgi:hypothetical protein